MLVIELVFFSIAVTSQIILPGKKTKGNLLTTLFIFFSSLLERIGHVQYNGCGLRILTEKKHARKLLLVVASFIFFLFSFELSTTAPREGAQ